MILRSRIRPWLLSLAALCASASAQQPPAAPVTVTEAQRSPIIHAINVTGTVTSPQAARLSAEIGGLVEKVLADAGDRMQQGQALLMLDDELARLALASARANAERAERELADARRRLAEAQVLVRDKSIAASTVRDLEAEVEIDAAALRQARAEAARQQAVVSRHRVAAPFAGAVSRKLVEVGEWVAPGTPVFELVATDGLRVDAQVPQEYFPRVGTDTEISVRLDALPDRVFSGEVGAIVPVNDPGVRTFLLRISLPAADSAVTAGMSARATLHLDTGREGLVVPRDALLRHPDGRVTVWVVGTENGQPVAEERSVRIGQVSGGRVEVRSGLEAGARVVVRGNEALQPGQPVKIVESAGER